MALATPPTLRPILGHSTREGARWTALRDHRYGKWTLPGLGGGLRKNLSVNRIHGNRIRKSRENRELFSRNPRTLLYPDPRIDRIRDATLTCMKYASLCGDSNPYQPFMPLRDTLNDENRYRLVYSWVVPGGCWDTGRLSVVPMSPPISLTWTACHKPSIVAMASARSTRSSLVAFALSPDSYRFH